VAYVYIGRAGFHMFGQAYAERTGKTPTAAGTSGQVASEPAAGTGSRQPEDV
jgi:hypothetical protein